MTLLLLALSACLQPQLQGDPVAVFQIRSGGETVGRAWLFDAPQGERVIWSDERAWDLSAEPGGTFRILARSGEQVQRGRYRLDQLPWEDGPLLRYQAPLLQAQARSESVEGVAVYDLASTLLLHDSKGLAAVYRPGIQLLREDRLPDSQDPLPEVVVAGVQRATVNTARGVVGSLHGPLGLNGLPGVVLDAATTTATDADFLALEGWLILRSPSADPQPFAALSLSCAPLVLAGPPPSPDAVRFALSTRGCPAPILQETAE
ncbi:MAG: hypothetical protein ACI9VR_000963 [Cognaticolwellia sp.]|jgi:hypothetical protein